MPGNLVKLSGFGSPSTSYQKPVGPSPVPDQVPVTCPQHPMVRIRHEGTVPQVLPHADEVSLTSQTKLIERICCELGYLTHPKMYTRPYPEEIKVQELFCHRLSGSICHMRGVTLLGRESSPETFTAGSYLGSSCLWVAPWFLATPPSWLAPPCPLSDCNCISSP